jgi:hypothetical protein
VFSTMSSMGRGSSELSVSFGRGRVSGWSGLLGAAEDFVGRGKAFQKPSGKRGNTFGEAQGQAG